MKNKKERKQSKGKKKKIKAKSFKGMEKLRTQSRFESEDEDEDVNYVSKKDRSKKKKISISKKKPKNSDMKLQNKLVRGTLVESETLPSEDSDNILIRGLTIKGESKPNIKMNTQEKLEANPRHRERVTAEYYEEDDSLKNSQNLTSNRNNFIDKKLIQQLRNEPSSDEEDIMEGIYLKESNLINGINPRLLKKSIQPKHQKDNTVINLNYSGDSDGFIDGDISEKHLSDEEGNGLDMEKDLIYGSKVKGFDSGKNRKNSKKRKKNASIKKQQKQLGEPIEMEGIRPKNDSLINPEELSKIVSGIKDSLNLIESNGGLTGLKEQNKSYGEVGGNNSPRNPEASSTTRRHNQISRNFSNTPKT